VSKSQKTRSARPGPYHRIPATADGLLGLDSLISPGVSDDEFVAILTQCARGLIIICRAFKGHACVTIASHIPGVPAVIDLMLDI
jgi:hypothetical protein